MNTTSEKIKCAVCEETREGMRFIKMMDGTFWCKRCFELTFET